MYTLSSLTDEDLGLVLNGTDWLTTPLDNAGILDNYNLEDVLNLPLDPFLFDPSITIPVDDSATLDLACLSWLDDLQTSTGPPLPVAEPSPSTDPPPLSPPSPPSPPSLPSLPSPPAPISPRSDPEPEPFSTFESRWQAVLDRTPTNSFVYGVISTKIYCRPTCPSRRPHRSNAIFFSTPAEGNQLGYRPCKRCRPEDEAGEAAEQRQAAAVERAKAFIEAKAKKGQRVGLEKLASEAGLSTFYFHRVFKRRVGVTPEEWGKMCRQRWAG